MCTIQLASAGIFVAPDGLDTNIGTIDSPFKTITKAVSIMAAGDTVFLRGGTYVMTVQISISKKGTTAGKYYLFAYNNERPLLDYSSTSLGTRGISLSGTFWHFKGLDIKGAGDNGLYITGSNNIIEFCTFFENRDSGVQLASGASNNQIINCDSYFNADPGQGNADGFAPKLNVGTGNYFYGCRAWQNSDDGWDGYMRPSDSVNTTLVNCWTFMNGYLKNGTLGSGNGNGFKMGGGDNSNADSLRHNMTLIRCLAFDNKVKGFDQNNNRGSMTLYNCTGFRNGTNYNISGKIRVTSTVTVKNCIAAGSGGVSLLSSAVQTKNSWLPPFSVTNNDFVSIDTTGVRGPRKPDGSLPDVPFMRLVAGSQFIDAGVDVGIAFNGSAPDLGAFEYGGSVSVKENLAVANNFMLKQNYPNPFNPVTTITYTLFHNPSPLVRGEGAKVTLKIYDVLGKEITTLVNENKNPGMYTVIFNGEGLSSGVYFYRLTAGKYSEIKTMILQK